MGEGNSIPYQLRPNKVVDRELFLSLLMKLDPVLGLSSYQYIGLGGPFMEDFRLIHTRLGMSDLICIEMDENTHKRQEFNKPFPFIQCVHKKMEDYLDSNEFNDPLVLWLDFTDPSALQKQIEYFSEQVIRMPLKSILRVTLNADPGSLGTPSQTDLLEIHRESEGALAKNDEVPAWRMQRLKRVLGGLFPAGLAVEGLRHKQYGKTILDVLLLAVDRVLTEAPERKVTWFLANHYSDGQPMVTATLLLDDSDNPVNDVVDGWEYISHPSTPNILDLPSLSTLERLTAEKSENAQDALGYQLPKARLGEDPFQSFDRYYRMYPHFAKAEL